MEIFRKFFGIPMYSERDLQEIEAWTDQKKNCLQEKCAELQEEYEEKMHELEGYIGHVNSDQGRNKANQAAILYIKMNKTLRVKLSAVVLLAKVRSRITMEIACELLKVVGKSSIEEREKFHVSIRDHLTELKEQSRTAFVLTAEEEAEASELGLLILTTGQPQAPAEGQHPAIGQNV